MKLLIIFGPPAVGKTTVGQIIESKTDYKLFHNHMIMDGVMHIFGVGSHSEDKLSRQIRTEIITEAAENNVNLIFTYVWNFAKNKGKINIDTYKEIYESNGGNVLFVELTAPLNVRASRAEQHERLSQKIHAPNAERIIQLEKSLNFTSPNPFFYPESYLHIDATSKDPGQIADEIIALL
jgi:cytidylate kinase